MSLITTPITPAIGAEVSGAPVASICDDAVLAREVAIALETHQVLVFRNQTLDREQHKAFGRLFGSLPHGGDTLFANMNLAFETLSQPIRQLLSGLWAHHDGLQDLRWYGYRPDPATAYPATSHPVVVSHPDTGRAILNVNEAFTAHIEGLSQQESEAILSFLFAHISQTPSFHCRVRWEPDTVVFWDNRAVQHFAVWDYFPHVRRGERVSICGADRPAAAFPG